MASANLPVNPVALYWVHWAPFKRLVNFPTTYNIIFLFHAYPAGGEPVGGSTGAVVLRKPEGVIGDNYNADIATCRARGQKIVISCGGAGGQTYITSQARADAFIASIKTINEGIGGSGTTNAFDGIDWNNFEGVQQGNQGAWMTYVGQQLKAFYGDDFIFTSPPAAFEQFEGGQAGSDRRLLAELYQGGVLDWLCPQYYDPFDLNTLANIRAASDFYNTAVTVNGQSVQIPRDYIGIGFSVAPTASSTRWSPSGAASAYTTIVSDGRTPKGAFNWANHEDTGDSFATTVAPVITNNTAGAPADDFNLAASANFTDSDATTAQLTAPSGKTSGADFQAGEMCETSNPAPAINLGSGKYTEIEWCIQATSDSDTAAQYEFRVTYNGNSLDTYSVTPKWTIGTPPEPPDTEAPSTPTNLTATAASSTQINLLWTDSTDNIGVVEYNIYRDSTLIDTSDFNTYVDEGLTPETLYSYTVSAVDAATNESSQSSSASDTTDAAPGGGDATVPVVSNVSPTGFTPEQSGVITLQADVTDDVAVARVEFYIGSVLVGTETTPTSGDTYSMSFNTLTRNNNNYSFDVVGVDTSENETGFNTILRFNNAEPPIIPADLPKRATAVGSFTGITSITI